MTELVSKTEKGFVEIPGMRYTEAVVHPEAEHMRHRQGQVVDNREQAADMGQGLLLVDHIVPVKEQGLMAATEANVLIELHNKGHGFIIYQQAIPYT